MTGTEKYWLTNSFSGFRPEKNSLYLLPAYDEFIISYKNRDAAIPPENQGRPFTTNGLFKPLIVRDGKVIGLWKRIINKDRVIIEMEFFQRFDKTPMTLINKAAEKYGKFIGKYLEVKPS
jgi:hypothetical protein